MASASATCHRLLTPLLSAVDLFPSANPPASDLSLRHSPEPPMFTGGSPSPAPPLKEEEQPRSSPPTAAPPPPAPAPSREAPSPFKPSRFPRACKSRPAHKPAPQPAPPPERRTSARREKEDAQQCSRVVTPLAQPPPSPSQLPRWELRSMWELASVLNFLHVFRPLLNIRLEFSAEELETALITPNNTLDDVHMPLLKAIPPVTRMALSRATWVTVLCRKLRDWWHWVAEGEIPIVASHGTEVETYRNLEPGTRVRILKAICDIRVEQEDIRNFIDDSLKRGIQLPVFRKERIGGDSQGISYWYEDDPIIGHRLYRETRRVELKKAKAKGSSVNPLVSYQWETVATNLDEFEDVAEKLFSSKNRTEASLGKKLKIDFLPDIEKIHKKKERLLKKQHREALLLDSYLTADGLSSGRSLRDRKPVTYTFDDYDRSINEAIKVTKKRQDSPENLARRIKPELSANGKVHDPSEMDVVSDDAHSPRSNEYEETDDNQAGDLDRSDRRRKRPQRYSEKDYVAAVSDVDAYFDSDDDIVGEAVYDEEYLRSRKQRKMVSSGSDEDEEYHWEEENAEDDEEEEEYSLSTSEDAEERQQYKKLPSRSKHEKKLRSVEELQTGLRRSRRSTRQRVNYRQYELSETDSDSAKPGKTNVSDVHSDASDELEASSASEDSQDEQGDEEMTDTKITQEFTEAAEKDPQQPQEKVDGHGQETSVIEKRRFLDLNELAPGTGFEDGLNGKDENMDNF